MTAKRALIVDDSKSARAFLSRILEKYEIGVETAESAEQAIEHLATHRPDVIFMDHLMPGMDGFQAVQLIKNNPRTATIPIMMYTSQEGELYLGQARALGAVGVLPKQIRPADVTKVLYQLKLVPDRRTGDQTSFRPLETDAANSGGAFVAAASEVHDTAAAVDVAATDSFPTPVAAQGQRPGANPELRELVETAVHGQIVELRQFVTMSLDDHAARTASDVRTLLQELPRAATAPREPRPNPLAWVIAGAGLLAAIAFGTLWSREMGARQAAEAKLAQSAAAAVAANAAAAATAAAVVASSADTPPVALPTGAMTDQGSGETLALPGEAAAPAPTGPAAPPSVQPGEGPPPRPVPTGAPAAGPAAGPPPPPPAVVTESVPYGEAPLAGARIEMLRATLSRAAAQGFHGVAEIRVFTARYCLAGNAGEGYALAAEDVPLSKCDLVGNPQAEAMPAAQRESLDFANLVGSMRQGGNGIEVRVVPADPAEVAMPYPPTGDKTTAGEWNRAAAANNRIEVRLRPAR